MGPRSSRDHLRAFAWISAYLRLKIPCFSTPAPNGVSNKSLDFVHGNRISMVHDFVKIARDKVMIDTQQRAASLVGRVSRRD